MSMRPINLPSDLIPLGEVITEGFQYPENEEWSVASDEQEFVVSSLKNFRRIWPIIKVLQIISPPMRDIFCGYVWEEDEKVVGLTLVQRLSTTETWVVTTVGVLPAYRRRGIARKLVEAGLDLIRERGGKRAFLNVIDGNYPAHTLYEQLGFAQYSGDVEFTASPEEVPPAPVLPEGYVQEPLARFDWQTRYELEKRITSPSREKYEPIEAGRYRYPFMMRLFIPLILLAQGQREVDYVIKTADTGKVVARFGYDVSTRGSSPGSIRARLDPDHPELAPYMAGFALNQLLSQSKGGRVSASAPSWMESVVAAMKGAGLKQRLEYCRMGVELEKPDENGPL